MSIADHDHNNAALRESALAKLSVLLVEENEHATKLVQSMLKGLGVRPIKLAADGGQALKILGEPECPVNVVISDVKMPKTNGLDLLRQVRATKPAMGFLIITGSTDVTTIKAAIDAKVDALIAKPFSPVQLEQKLLAVSKRL